MPRYYKYNHGTVLIMITNTLVQLTSEIYKPII